MTFKTHPVLGFPLLQINHQKFSELLDRILLNKKSSTRLLTIYSEYFVRAYRDHKFRAIITSADILTPDGIGPIWAANFIAKARGKNTVKKAFWLIYTGTMLIFSPRAVRKIFPTRISGADLWLDICHKCEKFNLPVYLVGRHGGLSSFDEVRSTLQKSFPGLKIHGDFTEKNLLKKIQMAEPAVIFCGFGVPDQDYFLAENLNKIPSARLGIGLGGSFDFLVGKQKRAPKWMQNLGLEWFWRLITRPGRWRRIYSATIEFIALVWKSAA